MEGEGLHLTIKAHVAGRRGQLQAFRLTPVLAVSESTVMLGALQAA